MVVTCQASENNVRSGGHVVAGGRATSAGHMGQQRLTHTPDGRQLSHAELSQKHIRVNVRSREWITRVWLGMDDRPVWTVRQSEVQNMRLPECNVRQGLAGVVRLQSGCQAENVRPIGVGRKS
ncbi:hypothetical protein LR48_Vigan03g050600 [Vigna angularis]|uniref:Uncharacterized protein n=1 Tax=Phaseolus angularis TaxID=3914 RepID=A0A0L9U2W2_PHAAN|nr:hypothetical protein LR48_Vigan03g050600 [Vigna angularis]